MKAHRGFTLVEVLIVMTIVGILTAVALPAYQTYVAKTRRGAAQTCAAELAQFLERNYTLALVYNQDSAGNAIALPATQCRTDLGNNFTFAFTLAANTYTVTATPSTAQAANDASCGCVMTLNELGVKGVSSCTHAVSDCWK
ncbi:MAG: prepilin-type N-terminal cleavage/methylation domain-containing protein [Rhodocyclaceae bacterium]|nr:prepilin-type N-terminal cleavage/methylation domain-containing protein [Rhodocyclaceae bacterium]